MDNPTLTWTCPLCGLETPEPEKHLRVHGMNIEQAIKIVEDFEEAQRNFARLFMISQEVGEVCMLCGQLVPEGHDG